VPDGKQVLALLDNKPQYSTPMLTLSKRWQVRSRRLPAGPSAQAC
jgi:hypothetical protein